MLLRILYQLPHVPCKRRLRPSHLFSSVEAHLCRLDCCCIITNTIPLYRSAVVCLVHASIQALELIELDELLCLVCRATGSWGVIIKITPEGMYLFDSSV